MASPAVADHRAARKSPRHDRAPGRDHDAADLVDHRLTGAQRRPPRIAADISATGALLLLAALVAIRHHDPAQAAAHLRSADVLADRLGGDRNDLWTGFGPINVLIHRVGIAAGTDPARAITLGEQLDTSHLHPALLSRRSQVHLDLAAAFTQRLGGDASPSCTCSMSNTSPPR